MEIGIGLPMWLKGATPAFLLDWAQRAEAGPFSSLGTLDRVAYHNFEPLTMYAAVAATTKRIRLTTSVLLATTRNAGILAKQAATVDAISGGRLTLGLGIGGREDDFKAAPEPFRGRGRRFEEQLDVMRTDLGRAAGWRWCGSDRPVPGARRRSRDPDWRLHPGGR